MINLDEIYIKHYCHPNCEPFMNICRLPKDDAFSLANIMAKADKSSNNSFSRFSNFEVYYPRRMEVDEYLHNSFISLGGNPKEEHPIFFVLHESKSLEEWMGSWNSYEILLKNIPSEYISFTLDDSIVSLRQKGKLTMYTKETLSQILRKYRGTIDDYLNELTKKYYCIEVQLWNDDYCIQ